MGIHQRKYLYSTMSRTSVLVNGFKFGVLDRSKLALA